MTASAALSSPVERAERHFRLGELHLKDQRRRAAREEFDKAVETVPESGYDVREEPRFQRYYTELVDRVYRLGTQHGAPSTQAGTARPPAQSTGGLAEDYVTAVINPAEAQFGTGEGLPQQQQGGGGQ